MPIFNSQKSDLEIRREELNLAAKTLHDGYGDIIYSIEHATFLHYTGKVYKPISELELSRIIADRFPTYDELSLRKKKDIMTHLKDFCFVRVSELNKGNGLNFNNGFFDMDKFVIKEHVKERYSTILLPYNYDPKAKCDLWKNSLNQIFEGDLNKINTLQEYFGYCLTKDTSMQKCLIMIGDGANGKGRILYVLKNMLGTDNVSVLPLKVINDASRTASLEGKLVNVCNEISKSIRDFEEDFKKLVDGDEIEVNPKYIKPYKVQIFCKLIFAINEMPFIDDKTHAFYRRLLILNFNKKFEEQEQVRNLDQLHHQELSGIFNWSLEGLKRLKERGFFVINEYMRRMVEDLQMENNPILAWNKETIEICPESSITKTDVYKSYYDWCISNGYKPLSTIKFGKEFYRIHKNVTNKGGYVGGTDTRQRIWSNLAFINPYKKEDAEW